MFSQEGAQGLSGNIFRPGESDVGMKGAEWWIEVRGKQRIMNMFVKSEKVGVSRADTRPNNGRVGATECADPADRKNKRRNPNLRELFQQTLLRFLGDISQKGEREMKLIRSQPANAADRSCQVG